MIRLENFKSYEGVNDIMTFHKSFTTIVGPNGNGKSNIIDALGFVFGKKSKELRSDQLTDLIHHGPNIRKARVTIFLQKIEENFGEDDEHFKFVPGSQFSIGR